MVRFTVSLYLGLKRMRSNSVRYRWIFLNACFLMHLIKLFIENSPKIENSDTKRLSLKWEYETLYVNCLKAQSICNFELLYTDKKKKRNTAKW